MLPNDLHAVMPAFNVAGTINAVIQGLLDSVPNVCLWIIDDGSTDNLSKKVWRSDQVEYIRNSINLGKGAALRQGFELSLAAGARLILTIDSDGQHNPFEAVKLINKLHGEYADIVLGARKLSPGAMPLHRLISNKITSFLISNKIGQRVPDSQSGFRVYRRWVIESVKLNRNNFDLETELLLKAAARGAVIACETIETIYLKDNFSSMKIKDVVRFIETYYLN